MVGGVALAPPAGFGGQGLYARARKATEGRRHLPLRVCNSDDLMFPSPSPMRLASSTRGYSQDASYERIVTPIANGTAWGGERYMSRHAIFGATKPYGEQRARGVPIWFGSVPIWFGLCQMCLTRLPGLWVPASGRADLEARRMRSAVRLARPCKQSHTTRACNMAYTWSLVPRSMVLGRFGGPQIDRRGVKSASRGCRTKWGSVRWV